MIFIFLCFSAFSKFSPVSMYYFYNFKNLVKKEIKLTGSSAKDNGMGSMIGGEEP